MRYNLFDKDDNFVCRVELDGELRSHVVIPIRYSTEFRFTDLYLYGNERPMPTLCRTRTFRVASSNSEAEEVNAYEVQK